MNNCDPYREWVRTLDPALKAELRDLHRIQPWKNLIALVFLGIWVTSAVAIVFFPYWPVRLGGYLVIGACINSLAILMHEALHGSFFRNRTLDRWCGFLLAVPAGISCHAYRVTHLLHHRHNRSELDPDEFTNSSPNRTVVSINFYAWLLVGGFVYLVYLPVTAFQRGSTRDRITILSEYVLLAAIYTGVYSLASTFGFTDVLIHCWLLPMLFFVAFTNVRGWAEHALTPRGHPLQETRTVISNRLVSFFMCNLNYHLGHHLHASVPWYNLRRLHCLLLDQFEQGGAVIYRSYFRFLWDGLRGGVHGLATGDAR